MSPHAHPSVGGPQGAPAPASPQELLHPVGDSSSGGSSPQGSGPRWTLRVLVGLLLALAASLGVARGLLARAGEELTREAAERRSFIALHALTDLMGRAGGSGDAVRHVVDSWQDQLPAGSAVRVIAFSGIRLEASTFPEDQGERAAPRRLGREEKALYDRGQRLRTAVETNREEGTARKREVEAEQLATGGLLLSAPVESEGQVVGSVDLAVPAPAAAPPPALGALLLALLLPLVVVGGAAAAGQRGRNVLVALASVAYVVGFGGYALHSARALGQQVRDNQQAAAQQLRTLGERARTVMASQSLAAEPALQLAQWDADAYRKPLGLLSPSGEPDAAALEALVTLRQGQATRALGGLGVLALGLLLFVGMGGANRAAEAAVQHRTAYAYIGPAMVGMVVLVFFPFFYGITLSFTGASLYNQNQPLADTWVGLRNYADILGSFDVVKRATDGALVFNYRNFYYTLFFTVAWTVTNVAISVTLGLLLALVLNVNGLALRPIYRVLLILPWAIPNYITALIWKGMFHRQFGVVNQLLQLFGAEGISWFDSPFSSFLTALATNVWLGFPFMMVVSLGALQSIPGELYEAAQVDGASRWQQFRAITLPSLKPALVPAIILSVVWTFNMFNIIYLVTDGEPGGSTEILVTQAFKYAFQQYRYGYAAAYSTVIFGILLLYSMVQNRMSRATEAA